MFSFSPPRTYDWGAHAAASNQPACTYAIPSASYTDSDGTSTPFQPENDLVAVFICNDNGKRELPVMRYSAVRREDYVNLHAADIASL